MKRPIGLALSGLVLLFFFVDAVTHILKIQPVVDAFDKLQIPLASAVPLGVLQLLILLVYGIPRTRILGAVLITGYLGGAVAIHVRASSTPFELIFPVLIGALLWTGLWLTDTRARVLF
jgi:hypothetical protein